MKQVRIPVYSAPKALEVGNSIVFKKKEGSQSEPVDQINFYQQNEGKELTQHHISIFCR